MRLHWYHDWGEGNYAEGGGMSEDVELYRGPAEALEKDLAYLKDRLKSERKDAARFELLAEQQGVGLARLVEDANRDVKSTSKLISDYRAAIKALRGRA